MFKTILMPLDGSSLAECVLPHAVAMARPFGALITLVHVCEPRRREGTAPPVNAVDWSIRATEADAYLEKTAHRLQAAGVKVRWQRLEGQAAEQILAFARQHDVDLIIVSSHGRSGLTGWNVSSVVQKIIARARLSVLVIRAYQPGPRDPTALAYSRLLLPLDCSQRAAQALPIATMLSRFHGAELLLAHVVPKPEMPRRRPLNDKELELINAITEMNRAEAQRYLQEVEASVAPEGAAVRSQLLVSENAAWSLHQLVDEEAVDLVLMSAHGFSGSTRRPYGSLVLDFVAYGTTPLLIVQDMAPDQLEPTQAEIAAREPTGH
jgi:nucleotide-binding universal stress UspA family protein